MSKDLSKDIEYLREILEDIIKRKKWNLLDEEVINASRMLNSAINQYNRNDFLIT
ncbi:MAG: aspartyl-phosphate phosphatase Spo0E family protein [Clostridiaceae bacterium]